MLVGAPKCVTVARVGTHPLADNAGMAKPIPRLPPAEIARVIATAWDDHPPFNAVLVSHGLTQGQLVQLLKRELTPSAFKLWKARASEAKVVPAARRAAGRTPVR